MKKPYKYSALFLVVTLLFLTLKGCDEPVTATAIKAVANNVVVIGELSDVEPINYTIAQHPFMSAQGVNGMHGDSFSSDVHPAAGPIGNNSQITSRDGSRSPGGQCATMAFDREGRIISLCTGLFGFRLHLLSPRSLELLAEYELPTRPSTFESMKYQDMSYVMGDSSGAYFYLDNQDRVVLADSRQTIRRIGHRQTTTGQWEFYDVDAWDLSEQIPHDCVLPTNIFPSGECDPITAVMPDYKGFIWWVTRQGRLGTLDVSKSDPNKAVKMMRLQGEEIQNGFSVSQDGIYLVSDHALYAMTTDANGEPKVVWRESYDRGSKRKVGSINQGSGSTPTILGDRYITITDNADDKINLLVFLRQKNHIGERLICQVPLFTSEHSATDNSMIGINRSIIVENNAGYSHARAQTDWTNVGGGIVRVDIREDSSGCDVIWQSKEHSPSVVAKMSAGNGLAYFYGFETQTNGNNAWFVKALDFRTGETRIKFKVGDGQDVDNNWSPLTIAPDGTIYIGVLKGLIALWDEPIKL